jgi:hypothetical protein
MADLPICTWPSCKCSAKGQKCLGSLLYDPTPRMDAVLPPRPPTLAEALSLPEVAAMMTALGYYADPKTYEPDKTYANQPFPIFDDEGALARAALAALKGGK